MATNDFDQLISDIGNNIRSIREKKNIPPKQLASELKITPQQLGNIELGKIDDIGIKRILEISNILQCNYHQLLNIENNTNYHYNASNNSGGYFIQHVSNLDFSNSEAVLKYIEQIINQYKK